MLVITFPVYAHKLAEVAQQKQPIVLVKEGMDNLPDLLKAIASLLWPVIVIILLFAFRGGIQAAQRNDRVACAFLDRQTRRGCAEILRRREFERKIQKIREAQRSILIPDQSR